MEVVVKNAIVKVAYFENPYVARLETREGRKKNPKSTPYNACCEEHLEQFWLVF